MKMTYKLLEWTRFVPYLSTLIFFILLTFPGMKNISIHSNAGYVTYAITGSVLLLAIHAGVAYIFLRYINKKKSPDKEVILMFFERFNILFGFIIVITFEGIFSSLFQYREWAYGVIRSESIIEKIEDNWNVKQLENSKSISTRLEKPVDDYTKNLYLKWQTLKKLEP